MRPAFQLFSLLLCLSCFGQPAPINRRAMAIAGLAQSNLQITNYPFIYALFESDYGTYSDANGTVSCTDGDSVLYWRNAPNLPTNYNFTAQITATLAPVWKSSGGPNNKPYIHFVQSDNINHGDSLWCNLSPAVLSGPNTLMMVFKYSVRESKTEIVFDSASAPGNRNVVYFRTDNQLYVSSDGTSELGAGLVSTSPQLLTVIFNNSPANTIIRTNGVQAAAGAITGGNFQWGTIGNYSGGNIGLTGDIIAVALWNTNLQGSFLTGAESYLLDKYALP